MLDYKPNRKKSGRWSPRRPFGARRGARKPVLRRSSRAPGQTLGRHPQTTAQRVSLRLPRLRLPPWRWLYAAIVLWMAVGIGVTAVTLWHAPLRHVHVTGNERFDATDVVRLSGLTDATTMATVNPLATAERLLAHPHIRRADVRREFPDTVRITIQERTPVARILRQGGGAMLLDTEGVVVAPLPGDNGAGRQLPVIVGVAVPDVLGTRVDDPALRRALAALAEVRALGIAGDAGLAVDVSEPFDVRLRIARQGRELVLPREGMGFALRHYVALSNADPGRLSQARQIDLRFAGMASGGRVILNP